MLLVGLSAPIAAAQGGFPQRDELIVQSIEIEFEGVRNVAPENVRAHILLREGDRFSDILADQSVRSLYESGNFEDVRILETLDGENGINLTFRVTPRYRISSVNFRGNDKVDTDDLEDEIELVAGMALDRPKINAAARALFDYLQNKGYSNAKVSFDIDRDRERGTGAVTFIIEEGQRFEIDDIDFIGNENFSEGKLENQMETQEYLFIWSFIVSSGRLIEEQLEDDLELLREFYRNEGYLDVDIDPAKVELRYPDEDELDIIITIDEGRQYRIGQISFADHTLFNDNTLFSRIQIRSGDVFSPEKIQEASTSVKDFYGRFGYLDTLVRVERSPNLETGNIDVTFRIREGDRYHVEAINVAGNNKTESEVIIRELALAPGDVFDLVRMKASENRLRNTRFFETVNLSPEATNIPNRRNLRVNVTEGRTGNVVFGVGFSSVDDIKAFVEVSQSNFDLFAWDNWFSGGGQKARIKVEYGTESSLFQLSFEEPWLFERRLAFGFQLYRQQSDFVSASFNEVRLGGEIYFRRRLFELVDARLSYLLEEVDIKDVRSSAPFIIREQAGKRVVSKVGLQLSRDTRNAFVWTTRGNLVTATWEFAGVGGDVDYINQEYRATQYFEITDDFLNHSIRLHARTGTIFNHTGGEVPIFDRYFLGGAYSIRGFDTRDVGPRAEEDDEEPRGGNTMAMAQAEYTIRIFDPLGIAAFYDVGYVNEDEFDWSPADLNDSWGVGLRIDVMNAPLNLDFSFPINASDHNDEGFQFHFSFGTTF